MVKTTVAKDKVGRLYYMAAFSGGGRIVFVALPTQEVPNTSPMTVLQKRLVHRLATLLPYKRWLTGDAYVRADNNEVS